MSYKHKTIIMETSFKSNKLRQKKCNKNVIFLFLKNKATLSKAKKVEKNNLHNM